MLALLADATIWNRMFAHACRSTQVSLIEKMVRPIIIYVFLLVGLRRGGKTRTGMAQRLRPDRAADAFQYGAKRDHRQRQFGQRRHHRRRHASGRQLSRRPRRAYRYRKFDPAGRRPGKPSL